MNARCVGVVAAMCGMFLSGCLQTKLMSENHDERMAAFASISGSDFAETEYENIIKGLPLRDPNANPLYGQQKDIPYPEDVKRAAVDSLYNQHERSRLIKLATDYDVKQDVKLVEYIYAKFITTEDWIWIFRCCEMTTTWNFKLEGNEKFLIWAIRNETQPSIERYFIRGRFNVNGRSVGACIVDEYMQSADSLYAVAIDKTVKYEARIAAGTKLLGLQSLKKERIMSTVESFSTNDNGIDESDIRKIAEAGIAALSRIGSENDAQIMRDKYAQVIGKAKANEEARHKYAEFWSKVRAVESFFAESSVDFAGPPKAKKGDLFCYDGWYRFNGGARMDSNPHVVRMSAGGSECCAVVKQVVDDGIIVGRDNPYDEGQEIHFINRIFIKTNDEYADGSAIKRGMLLKYIGIKKFKKSNGGTVSFHAFEQQEMPEFVKQFDE